MIDWPKPATLDGDGGDVIDRFDPDGSDNGDVFDGDKKRGLGGGWCVGGGINSVEFDGIEIESGIHLVTKIEVLVVEDV